MVEFNRADYGACVGHLRSIQNATTEQYAIAENAFFAGMAHQRAKQDETPVNYSFWLGAEGCS